LNLLANSRRHLLTAQVPLSDRMDRAETAIQKLAEENVKLAEKTQVAAEKVDALSDIVRSWYERHGNGSSGQHPS